MAFLMRALKLLIRYFECFLILTLFRMQFCIFLKKEFGLSELRPFLVKNWHLGCHYFLGKNDRDRTKVFIKVGTRYSLVKCDANMYARLAAIKENCGRHFAHYLGYGENNKFSFLVINFVEGISLREVIDSRDFQQKGEIIYQLVKIAQLLQAASIIHRDVRPENIICQLRDGCDLNLVLIDFSFAIVDGENSTYGIDPKKLKKVLSALGGGLNPKPMHWDDAYAFCNIANMIDPRWKDNFPESYAELTSMIGKLSYDIS